MKDLPGTVTAVAKMGYQVVEFYSPYFDWTVDKAKEVAAKAADDLGIKRLVTTTVGSRWATVSPRPSSSIRSSAASGHCPGRSRQDSAGLDGWKALADRLSAASEKLKPLGMAAGFHNHQLEWRPVEGKRPMDILAANTPKDVVLQLDCGTCVEAGADPVAWIKANPGGSRART